MKKIVADFYNGKKILENSDYFLHTLYPLIKDKRILHKLIFDLEKSCNILIKVLLDYEYSYKRISSNKFNLDIFKKISKKYDLKDELTVIDEIISKCSKLRSSEVEFLRNNKLVAIKKGEAVTFSFEDLKKYLLFLKLAYKKILLHFRKDLLISRYLH